MHLTRPIALLWLPSSALYVETTKSLLSQLSGRTHRSFSLSHQLVAVDEEGSMDLKRINNLTRDLKPEFPCLLGPSSALQQNAYEQPTMSFYRACPLPSVMNLSFHPSFSSVWSCVCSAWPQPGTMTAKQKRTSDWSSHTIRQTHGKIGSAANAVTAEELQEFGFYRCGSFPGLPDSKTLAKAGGLFVV